MNVGYVWEFMDTMGIGKVDRVYITDLFNILDRLVYPLRTAVSSRVQSAQGIETENATEYVALEAYFDSGRGGLCGLVI